MTTKQTYSESDIKILKGLEPIKLRPSQFTRVESPLHIVQEALDNAVDEALAGYASEIKVELHDEKWVSISDNGRGIPVGMHPEEKIPVVQAIFTVLYSGGKFDKTSEDSAYKFSGGLHGVGVSVTNALSDLLKVEVQRDGFLWSIQFENGAVTKKLNKEGPSPHTGTKLEIHPNPKYFDSVIIPKKEFFDLVKSKALILKGVKVTYTEYADGIEVINQLFSYENGPSDYLKETYTEEALCPIISDSFYYEEDAETTSKGEGCEWALIFGDNSFGESKSFVNLINTPLHGTHVSGLKSALFNTIKMFGDHHNMVPKGVKLNAEDCFKTVGFFLSVKMLDPAFDNQTKDRLQSRNAVKLIEQSIQPKLEAWFNKNTTFATAIAELCFKNAMSRQRASDKVEKKKSSSIVMLPGKLTNCESKDAALNELYLVEGDSAGGSAKMARSKENQALLALRGKPLNTWEIDIENALKNTEIADIQAAIGVPLHTMKDDVDLSKLRYHKICILSDADVDGSHIQTILLTFFLKHYPKLIDAGHIYVAQPPLYRIDAESSTSGKKKQLKKIYAMDEAELELQLKKLEKEGYKNIQHSRFKGLGEMNPDELWDTTLNPETRVLIKITLPEDLKEEGYKQMNNFMHKDNAAWRREWMERRGHEIELD